MSPLFKLFEHTQTRDALKMRVSGEYRGVGVEGTRRYEKVR